MHARVVLNTAPQDWEYANEGGSNIVFSYCGTKQLLKGTMLRVVKREGLPSLMDSENPLNAALLEFYFCRVVMKRVLGKWMVPQVLVELDHKFLLSLHTNSLNIRPSNRLKKSIDLTQRFGLLMADLTQPLLCADDLFGVFHRSLRQPIPSSPHPHAIVSKCRGRPHSLSSRFPVTPFLLDSSFSLGDHAWAIEIKPKCGFVRPNLTVCDYCMRQCLKLSRGQISSLSQYCPLELFSGDVHRIHNALLSLTSNPQNNLRVSKGHELVDLENLSASFVSNLMRLVARVLVVDNLLSTLLSLQRLHVCSFPKMQSIVEELTARGIFDDELNHLPVGRGGDQPKGESGIRNENESGNENNNHNPEPSSPFHTNGTDANRSKMYSLLPPWWRNHTMRQVSAKDEWWFREHDFENFGDVLCPMFEDYSKFSWMKEEEELTRVPTPQLIGALSSFLISTCCKDVSLILRITEQSHDTLSAAECPATVSLQTCDGSTVHCAYQLYVVDIAPKSPSSVRGYIQKDKDIREAFRRFCEVGNWVE